MRWQLVTCLDVYVRVQLIEFLSDQNELAATDVLVFVREATQRFEQLRPVIISKLLDTSPSIKSVKYVRHFSQTRWLSGRASDVPRCANT